MTYWQRSQIKRLIWTARGVGASRFPIREFKNTKARLERAGPSCLYFYCSWLGEIVGQVKFRGEPLVKGKHVTGFTMVRKKR